MAVQAASLLLCNYVYEDPVSHNVTLLGIFTSLRATKFPTPFRAMMVYALLTGDPAESGELRLQCAAEATGAVCVDETVPTQIGLQGKRHIRLWLDNIRFPAPDDYRFTVAFDGEVIGEITIPVLESDS